MNCKGSLFNPKILGPLSWCGINCIEWMNEWMNDLYSALKLQMSTFIMSWTLWCRIINKSSRQNKINKT